MTSPRQQPADRRRHRVIPAPRRAMLGWVDVGKRRFFALLWVMIAVEVAVVVLLVRLEHDRFPPLPADTSRKPHLGLDRLRSTPPAAT